MRYLSYVIVSLSILMFSSCHHDEEPDAYVRLKVIAEIEPKSKILNWVEMTPEERREYPRAGYVINSIDDFPADAVFGIDDIKSAGIDFSTETLLLDYILVPGYVQGHRFIWMRNNIEGKYEFRANFDITDSQPFDFFTYYRAAIVVSKLAPGEEVLFTMSY